LFEFESVPYILEESTFLQAGYQGDTFKLRVPFPRRAEDRK